MSHGEKLRWAYVHLDALDAAVGGWLRDKPYREVREKDVNAWQYVIDIERTKPFGDDWPMILGDCLHNARCALDHLVYSLATLGGVLPKHTKIQFPIFETRTGFKNRSPEYLRGVPQLAQDAILSLQPHVHYFGTQPDEGQYWHPLWRLHRLNGVDKHRHFVIHGMLPKSMSVRIGEGIDPDAPYEVRTFGVFGGPFPESAEVFRANMVPGFNGEPEVNLHFTPNVAIHQPDLGTNMFLRETAREILDHIRDVVFPKLEPFLT